MPISRRRLSRSGSTITARVSPLRHGVDRSESDLEAADRTIALVLTGPDPLAAIGSAGSRYQPGDLLLTLDYQRVAPDQYDVAVGEGGELAIVLRAEQPCAPPNGVALI